MKCPPETPDLPANTTADIAYGVRSLLISHCEPHGAVDVEFDWRAEIAFEVNCLERFPNTGMGPFIVWFA
jgi:hypothetical protein